MKNLKIILSVAVIAALMTMSFASCGDPEPEPDPDASWTVTFKVTSTNTNPAFIGLIKDGKTEFQKTGVADQSLITAIDNAYQFWAPTSAGLYKYRKPTQWNGPDGKKFDFDKTKISADITLTAVFQTTGPNATTLTGSGSDIEKAVSTAAGSPEPYIFVIGSDITTGATVKLTTNYLQLYLLGLTSEKKIIAPTGTLTAQAPGRIFEVGGTSGSSTIALTLGNNVTLQGRNDNNSSLVLVQGGALLQLLTGSKITGNTSSGDAYANKGNNHGYGVGGVHVDGATLIVNGGTITGNSNGLSGTKGTGADATSAKNSAGGIYAEAGGKVNLQSGSTALNTNPNGGSPDIYFTATSSLTIGGNTTGGTIGLGTGDPTNAYITASPGFSGSATINLMGVAGNWLNKQVVQGGNTGFTLGNFIGTTTTVISNTHKLSSTGTLIAN